MDSSLRELERLAGSGDEDARVRLGQALARAGRVVEARALLQPHVRGSSAAAQVFVGLLPTDAHAFCVHCAASMPLGPNGYPRTTNGRESRKRRLCQTCTDRQAAMAAWHHGAGQRRFPVITDPYCGKCGCRKTAEHHCVELPDWISGGERSFLAELEPPLQARPVPGPADTHWAHFRG